MFVNALVNVQIADIAADAANRFVITARGDTHLWRRGV
jgi:hypothetical protein